LEVLAPYGTPLKCIVSMKISIFHFLCVFRPCHKSLRWYFESLFTLLLKYHHQSKEDPPHYHLFPLLDASCLPIQLFIQFSLHSVSSKEIYLCFLVFPYCYFPGKIELHLHHHHRNDDVIWIFIRLSFSVIWFPSNFTPCKFSFGFLSHTWIQLSNPLPA